MPAAGKVDQVEQFFLPSFYTDMQQAEQVLEQEPQDERGSYHRAEVLADAATGLLEEHTESSEFDQIWGTYRCL